MSNDLNELRRNAVVSIYGPGAVVDFRADNAPVSGVVSGLEVWDQSFGPEGMKNPQRIYEQRLQKKLKVQGFRLPPLTKDQIDSRRLIAVRFPSWLQCPNCKHIKPAGKWNKDPGKAYRYCGLCTNNSPHNSPKCFVIPVRFVLACDHGHLDEFPWDFWVNHEIDCKNKFSSLKLESEGPGLAGLILSCPKCQARKSMDNIFSRSTWSSIKCRGKRPWLDVENEKCNSHLVAVQRGASNLYFPVIESALSIPPWTDPLPDILGNRWSDLVDIPNLTDRTKYIQMTTSLKQELDKLRMTSEELSRAVENHITSAKEIDTKDLRPAEYRQFTDDTNSPPFSDKEFEVRHERVPPILERFFSKLVKVVRLREVRTIRGFTRINPPGEGSNIAPLSAFKQTWLPAIEVRGEGIFLSLSGKMVNEWERRPGVMARANECNQKYQDDLMSRFGENITQGQEITPRYMLCHTLAHALMRQLTLECGYSAASLQERIFASTDKNQQMAGILIYTASSSADGTLGGLQRQGRTSRIGGILTRSIRSLEWCSSDPLCITDSMGAITSYSKSVCHACVLSPETSCESFNNYLDRAFLVGLPNDREIGYFCDLLN